MGVIRQLQKDKMGTGTPVCKTSRAFMFGMIGESDDYVYLQRGFRQYGQMHVTCKSVVMRSIVYEGRHL